MNFPVLWKFAGILSAALSQSSQENPTPNKTNEKVLDLTVEEEASLTVKVHEPSPWLEKNYGWSYVCKPASKNGSQRAETCTLNLKELSIHSEQRETGKNGWGFPGD